MALQAAVPVLLGQQMHAKTCCLLGLAYRHKSSTRCITDAIKEHSRCQASYCLGRPCMVSSLMLAVRVESPRPDTARGAPLQQLHQAGPVSSQQHLQDGRQAAQGQPVQERAASQQLQQAQHLEAAGAQAVHTCGPGPVAEAVEGSGSSNLQLPFVLQSSSSQVPSRWACLLLMMQSELG